MTEVTGEEPNQSIRTGAVAEPAVRLSTRQAAFIGVGSMVGAGIFSLLGAAGEVAGAAVWISFLIAGAIAGLQGYSFAKLGARYPSAGGLMEYVGQIFGADRHLPRILAWLLYAATAVVTAMGAVSFGSYASSMLTDGDDVNQVTLKLFAVGVVAAMTILNVVGSQAVARAQTVVVIVVIGILLVFAVTTLVTIDPSLLAPSGYPPLKDIVSSVALTFFAFLGFGVITFTAKDLSEPKRQLPRAMYLALGIATTIYLLVSLGVFGTLTVDNVIASGGTALAVAAEPVLGQAGYWLMSITALFATAGATNAGLYPATGLGRHMADTRQWPPVMGRTAGPKASWALLITALAAALLALFFDLTAIASIGSAVALTVFAIVSGGHLRIRRETGAKAAMLILAVSSTVIVLATFVFTTLMHEPGTAVALVVIVVVSAAIDVLWKRRRPAVGAG
ncbi:MAG: APC family permease [Acidimicrobiales bacterium]